MIKQKKLIVISIILVLIILGLSLYYVNNFPPTFDDDTVSVLLVNQEITPDGLTYTIKVTNDGRYTLKSNTLYFTARHYMQPVEAKVTEGDKVLIKPGEQVKFTVFVLKEQFTDLQSSQNIFSEVILKGYVSWWFWKVPFNKGGGVNINHPSLS